MNGDFLFGDLNHLILQFQSVSTHQSWTSRTHCVSVVFKRQQGLIFSRFFENLTIALKKSFSSPILGHRPYQRPFYDPRFSLLFKRKSALESRLFKRVYTYIEMTSVITKSCVMAVFTWIIVSIIVLTSVKDILLKNLDPFT